MIPNIVTTRAAAMQKQWQLMKRKYTSLTDTFDNYFDYVRCSGNNAITGSSSVNSFFNGGYLRYYHDHSWTNLYPLADATLYRWIGRVDGDTITALRIESNYGVWRSTDNGANWTEIFPNGGSRTSRKNLETSGGKIVIYKPSTTTYYKYNGSTRETLTFPSAPISLGMDGDRMIIVGSDGKIYHYDGSDRTEMVPSTVNVGESRTSVGMSGDYMFATKYRPVVIDIYVYNGVSWGSTSIDTVDDAVQVTIGDNYVYVRVSWYDILNPSKGWRPFSNFSGIHYDSVDSYIVTASSGTNLITVPYGHGVYKLYGSKE